MVLNQFPQRLISEPPSSQCVSRVILTCCFHHHHHARLKKLQWANKRQKYKHTHTHTWTLCKMANAQWNDSFFCIKTHCATHDRPQPGPSDWLLLPACCSFDRSMCSTYVWIICQKKHRFKKIKIGIILNYSVVIDWWEAELCGKWISSIQLQES